MPNLNEQILGYINKYSTEYGIDPQLALDLATAESTLNPKAVGGAGERGLYQIHPKFADWISTTVTGKKAAPNDYFNPDINSRIGIGYLKYLKDQLGERYTPALLLQSYNQGLGYTKKNKYAITDEMKKHPNAIYRKYLAQGQPAKPAQAIAPEQGAVSFARAFSEARSKGLPEFVWKGNRYATKVKS
jgi:membrane-bound lytic murein transglycosylase MltF